MLTGTPPTDPNKMLQLLWHFAKQHQTDITRLWNATTNRMWVNQTNQPGGGSSQSTSSSSSSSYTGDSDPPACPDGEGCDFTVANTTTCCCSFVWYGAGDGWKCTGATSFCSDPCYAGSLGCENCNTEPSDDGEYIGQICYMAGDDCAGDIPDCPCGYCRIEWDGDEWLQDLDACSGGCMCFPNAEPDGEFVGELRYRCCEI